MHRERNFGVGWFGSPSEIASDERNFGVGWFGSPSEIASDSARGLGRWSCPCEITSDCARLGRTGQVELLLRKVAVQSSTRLDEDMLVRRISAMLQENFMEKRPEKRPEELQKL